MKKLLNISLIAAISLYAVACSTTNLADVVKAASGDPATVVVKITTVYGTATITRIGATNIDTTVTPDGVAVKALK